MLPLLPRATASTKRGFRRIDTLNGGNGDDRIDASDRIFDSLSLWIDRDRDGQTDPRELRSLGKVGLKEISLRYSDTKSHRDVHGNVFQFSAPVRFASGRVVDAWMVYFNVEECTGDSK